MKILSIYFYNYLNKSIWIKRKKLVVNLKIENTCNPKLPWASQKVNSLPRFFRSRSESTESSISDQINKINNKTQWINKSGKWPRHFLNNSKIFSQFQKPMPKQCRVWTVTTTIKLKTRRNPWELDRLRCMGRVATCSKIRLTASPI